MFYKIVISLNMWFKRHGLCKKKKIRHMKVQDEEKKIWTHEGPKVLKKIYIGTYEGPKEKKYLDT